MLVAVGEAVSVGVAEAGIVGGVGVSGVEVAGTGVSEPAVDVRVGRGVSDSAVVVGRGVNEEMGVGVDVGNIGAPNSLHPRSGAMPVNPAIGVGGTSSPLFALN